MGIGCGGGGGGGPTAANPPAGGALASLQVTPAALTLTEGETAQLSASPLDGDAKLITGLPSPSYTTNDPSVASVDQNGLVTGVSAGGTQVAVRLTADGVTKSTLVAVTVTAPPQPGSNLVTTIGVTFSPSSIAIAENDSVTWRIEGAVHNVTFNGAAPTGGNIPDQPSGTAVSRTFAVAGTYPYECTIHNGMVGEVVVSSTTPPVYSALSVSPTSPAIDVGEAVTLAATPLDQYGTAMSGLPAPSWQSLDPAVATVDPSGVVTGVADGTVDVMASVTSGGVTHTGTASVTVLSTQAGAVIVTTPNRTFNPPNVVIPPGGTVTWQFSESTHNVTFAGVAPPGGDIPDLSPGNSASRTFTTEGTYDYECTRHGGMVGTIEVQAGAPPPPPPPAGGTTITVGNGAFTPDRVDIAPGEAVTWQFEDAVYNVTFDGPAPPGGDIPDSNPGTSASRTFPVPGDYDFECTLHSGMSGRVRVR